MSMCRDADSIGTALFLNRSVKQKGGIGWDDRMIESANDVLLIAIKDDLVREWNSLVTKK